MAVKRLLKEVDSPNREPNFCLIVTEAPHKKNQQFFLLPPFFPQPLPPHPPFEFDLN